MDCQSRSWLPEWAAFDSFRHAPAGIADASTVSEPHGQSPVQHLQLAAGLASAPDISANSAIAAVLAAQEMPALSLAPAPTPPTR